MDLYFKILKALKKNGVNNNLEIFHLFNDEYLTPVDKEVREKLDYRTAYLILPFLDRMQRSGHINFQWKSTASLRKFEKSKWIYDEYEINAHLTSDGLMYYLTHRSIINQRTYNIITWAIALMSIMGTIGMGIYTTNQNSAQQRQLNWLTQQVQQLKSSRHSQVASTKNLDTMIKKH